RDSSESVPASTSRRVSKDTVSRDTASLREDGGGEQTRLHLRRFSKQEVLRATSISLSRDAGGERGDVRGCARARESSGLRELHPELSHLRERRNRLQRALDPGWIQRLRVGLHAHRELAVLREA